MALRGSSVSSSVSDQTCRNDVHNSATGRHGRGIPGATHPTSYAVLHVPAWKCTHCLANEKSHPTSYVALHIQAGSAEVHALFGQREKTTAAAASGSHQVHPRRRRRRWETIKAVWQQRFLLTRFGAVFQDHAIKRPNKHHFYEGNSHSQGNHRTTALEGQRKNR